MSINAVMQGEKDSHSGNVRHHSLDTNVVGNKVSFNALYYAQ